MRLTTISHTYIVRLNRAKLAWLTRDHAAMVQLVVPERWEEGDLRRALLAEPGEPDLYRLDPLPYTPGRRPALKRYPYRLLRRRVREFMPDVLHVEEEPWSLSALQAALLARECGLPLTLFTWENLDRRLPPPFGLTNRLVLRRTAHLIAGSAAAEQVARKRGYRGPVTRMPQLGVDPELFSSVRAANAGRAPGSRDVVVGFVGRLVRAKGVELLLEALARLPSRFRLLFVGDGPLAMTLRETAAARGCAARVTFAGSVSHEEVPRCLREMHVLVLPSLSMPEWTEQFGHVLIEGMACALPVIGSDSGAIPEVIGDAGLVVPEGDVAALAEALERLGDPELRQELARRGRQRVLNEFSDQAIARRLAAALLAATGRRRTVSAVSAPITP